MWVAPFQGWSGRLLRGQNERFRGLFLNTLGGFLGTVAGDFLPEFHDDAVVNHPIDGRRGGHGIFEDLVPLREDQVRGDDDAAAFVTLRQERKEYFHLVARLLNIADVVEDQNFIGIQAAEFRFEPQVALGA